MKVSFYSKVYSGKDVLSVSHCNSHKIHCSVRTQVRLQPMTENSNETRTWTFLPSVWLLNQQHLYQSSLLEAQTSPEWHCSLRLFLPSSPFNLFLNGSQTCIVVSELWASLGSHSPFTGIALNNYLVILTPSWSLLPGWLPDAPWIDTLLPTTADLLFSVEIRFALSMITVYIHLSAWQSGDLSILRLSGVNCIFIAK